MATNHLHRPHYSNCLMVSHEGKPLTTCGDDRVDWYLDRSLAKLIEWPDKRFSRVIQLSFVNKGSWSTPNDLIAMQNHCVVCGREDTLSLHHVVPYAVKRHYPMRDKEHTRNQCVLLCEEHHKAIEELNRTHAENPHAGIEPHLRWLNKIMGRYTQFLKKWATRIWRWRKGGVKSINRAYIDLFMTMKPKHLPEGWLQP